MTVLNVLDITMPGIDMIFRDNCYSQMFILEDEFLSEIDLLTKAMQAVELLSEFFKSEICMKEQLENITALQKSQSDVKCSYIVQAYGPGESRIAVPEGSLEWWMQFHRILFLLILTLG